MSGLLAIAALIAIALAGRSGSASSSPAGRARFDSPARSHGRLRGIHKIRHVVIIMQENRSFDNYFGTYPRADGIPGLGGHRGKVPCIPDPGERCVRPFHDRHDLNGGGPYGFASATRRSTAARWTGSSNSRRRPRL